MWLALFLRSRGSRKQAFRQEASLPDEEIIARYRADKDPQWIGLLADRYLHLVYGVCLKYLKNQENARDATMEIFEKLLADLLRHELRSFRSWLFTVARNHCLMKLRADRPEIRIDGWEKDILFVKMDDPLHLIKAEEKEQKLVELEQAINRLSPEQGQCIRLFYLEKKSYQEVSEITGYSLKQVKSHVQNGKRNLKIMFNAQS